jgi:hypothetical protein
MSGLLISRRLRVLGMVALCSVTLVPNLRAEPIIVTSGRFVVETDDPTFLRISGTDGFFLFATFIRTPRSPGCSFGCAPGSAVSMGAVAGGASADFSIGALVRANINGTEFVGSSPGTGAPTLTGTLLFDAPILTLPSLNVGDVSLTAPFNFNGQVTGFADVDAPLPLFRVTLVGQGTASAFFLSDAGSYVAENVTYTFLPNADPIPEPTTVALFGTGLIGMVARAWKRKRTARDLA